MDVSEILEPLEKLSKDFKNAAKTLKEQEVRYLVDTFYVLQKDRIKANSQVRAMSESGEPHEILVWMAKQSGILEHQIKRVLAAYVQCHKMGKWLLDIYGIGHVISAGLLAHIDINIADTAGKIWSYAGIDVGTLDKKWEKGQKRPWNANLKVLCYKIGESFVKVSGKEEAVYGQYYAQKKEWYLAKNESGGFKELAARNLAEKKYNKDTDAYKAYIIGKLPPAHIHAMAKRSAVKLFLSHFQQVWYEAEFHKPAPAPFPIAHLGHKDYIAPPGRKVG